MPESTLTPLAAEPAGAPSERLAWGRYADVYATMWRNSVICEMGFKAKELQQTTADLSGEAFDAARASCVATRESMRCMR